MVRYMMWRWVTSPDAVLSITFLCGHQHQQPLSAETSPTVQNHWQWSSNMLVKGHQTICMWMCLCVQVRICQSTEWGLFSTLAVHSWSAYTRRTVRMHLLLIHCFLKCLFEFQALLDIWWKDKPHHGLGSTETAHCFSKRFSLWNFDYGDDKHIARESP